MSDASGGTLLRRLLKVGVPLFARFSRSLERISPRLGDLLLEITETAHNVQQQSMIARREVTLHVGETTFRVCLAGGREVAGEYLSLAAKGEVYEPVATACLTRLLQRLPEPTFVDVGAYAGYFTCYAASLLGDRRPVFAVESNPIFCEAIRHAVALNGF